MFAIGFFIALASALLLKQQYDEFKALDRRIQQDRADRYVSQIRKANAEFDQPVHRQVRELLGKE